MKTIKNLSYFLVAGAMMLGTACSTTNTDATTGGTTSGSGTSASGAGNSGASSGSAATSATGTSTGTGPGTDMGSASSTTETTSAAGGATGAGGDPTDMNAFMGTFATMKDPVFVLTAASSNMLEIQAGQMAVQKASNAEVKKFGQMMIDHHTRATQDMKTTVATPLGITMPTVMMPVHQAMVDKLMNKSGRAFDEAYMDMMETAHKLDIAMFEVKSKGAETPTVQTFATKTLPMLRSHSTMASALEKKVD